MFLSKFEFNGARRGTARLLASPQRIHAAVEASFPSEVSSGEKDQGERRLWRVDQASHNPVLYVVSTDAPDFTHLAEQAGWPTKVTWGVADYMPLLQDLAAGQIWQFRLAANPVHTEVRPGAARGKRFAHVTVAQQEAWLQKRAAKLGVSFDVPADRDSTNENGSSVEEQTGAASFRLEERRLLKFPRGNSSSGRRPSTVTISRARFDGLLRVTDPERLGEALTKGIGPAKAYGCGLMTLAPVQHR